MLPRERSAGERIEMSTDVSQETGPASSPAGLVVLDGRGLVEDAASETLRIDSTTGREYRLGCSPSFSRGGRKEMEDTRTAAQDQQSAVEVPSTAARTRRSLLTAAVAAAGALVATGIARPEPVSAASVVLGGSNTTNKLTKIINNKAASDARALLGRTSYTGGAGSSAGVYGDSKGHNGRGVLGTAHSGSNAKGVHGSSNDGYGVYGQGGYTGTYGTSPNYGAQGIGGSTGVYGSGSSYGVYGSGGTYGVYGSGDAYGVIGSGSSYGVVASGPNGAFGGGSGNGNYGVWGTNTSSGGYGVYATGGTYGVYGSATDYGVYGSGGSSGYGLYGDGVYGVVGTGSSYGTYGLGTSYGVYGYSSSGYGVTGSTSSGYAGVLFGDVYVGGTLSKSGGSFKIDHPLEPERRYLVHSFVEAPEMLNVYSGTVTLNSQGRATVSLPRYFGAANSTYRYQLTAIVSPAPNLHVSRLVAGNRFSIAGGAAGLEVSWMVTGVRADPWAKANPLRVEPLKKRQERGKYLQPKLYGKSASAGIFREPRKIRQPKPAPDRRPPQLKAVG
jgi:hypothetical protein